MRGFATPFVLALGPEASQEVLANNDHVFSQKGQEFFSGRFFKRGLMFLDFEEHHFHRRIMQEAFTRERLSGYLQSMDTICAAAQRRGLRTNYWFTRTSNARSSTSPPSRSWARSPDHKAA